MEFLKDPDKALGKFPNSTFCLSFFLVCYFILCEKLNNLREYRKIEVYLVSNLKIVLFLK